MCKPILLSGFLILSSGLFAQSPGGITRHSLWLKGNFSTEAQEQPTLNFHPAIAMEDSKARIKLPHRLASLRRVTVFTVYQDPTANEERAVWEMNGDFGDLLLSTKQILSRSSTMNIDFAKNNPQKTTAVIHTYFGNTIKGSSSENNKYKEAAILFGNSSAAPVASTSPGLISEFILYEKILTEKEINKIETYLALKYGITLQHNYVSASGDILWNLENDRSYSNNIAGIARDDQSALYQKQSTSCNNPEQLVIGINKIATSNNENTGLINDKDHLIWGDNAQPLTLQENADNKIREIELCRKKWLIKSSGSSAYKISTGLQINISTLLTAAFSKNDFCLVIDRSANGEFAPENCSYIKPDNISEDGIASFSNVYWDTDGSGKDLFSFGFRPKDKINKDAGTLLSFQLYPNPVTDGQYKMAITLEKPADIQVQVYDIHQRLVQSSKGAGRSSYLFTGFIHGPAGSYTVRVITPQKEYSRIIIVQ